MRNLTLFIFLIFIVSISAQSNSLVNEIDPDFIEQVYKLSEKRGGPRLIIGAPQVSPIESRNTRLAEKYKDANPSKFAFLIKYHKQIAKKNQGILKDEFLKKPSLNDLASIYLNDKVQQNHWAGNEKLETKELIEWELTQITEDRLVAHYYSSLFLNPTRSKRNMNNRNIDFEDLGLTSRQGSILYHKLISAFCVEYLRKQYKTKKLHCNLAKSVSKRLPTFAGKKYDKFIPENLEDFTYIINKFREPAPFSTEGSHNSNLFLKLCKECGSN